MITPGALVAGIAAVAITLPAADYFFRVYNNDAIAARQDAAFDAEGAKLDAALARLQRAKTAIAEGREMIAVEEQKTAASDVSVPPKVKARIKAYCAHLAPDGYIVQELCIDEQVKAWRNVEQF